MNRFIITGFLIVSLALMSACGSKNPGGNPPSTSPEPSNTNTGRLDPEDPKAGTNTNRPDSIKDVKPDAGSGPLH